MSNITCALSLTYLLYILGCPIEKLTNQILRDAFLVLLAPETKQNVLALQSKMVLENGVDNAINSFHKHLPMADMLCEISIFQKKSKVAKYYCKNCDFKMCPEVMRHLHRQGSGKEDHLVVLYCAVKWGTSPPSSLLKGIARGVVAFAYEAVSGLFSSSANLEEKVSASDESFNLIYAAPERGGILIDCFKDTSGHSVSKSHAVNDFSSNGIKIFF